MYSSGIACPLVAPRVTKVEPATPAILTADEVAEYLRVAKKTVYSLAKQGQLRSFRVGRAMRFHRGDVEAFVDEARAAELEGAE